MLRINKDSFSRETLDNIMVQIENLATWRAENFVPTTTTSTVETCLDGGFKQVRHLIGIHKLKAKLISRMSSSSQQLKVVSIWTPGGMGKTTLAKAVYENIRGDFDCRAFVSAIPQADDVKKVLRDILICLGKERYSDLSGTMLNEGQLIEELQHFLEKKRFLIVIDDIRDIRPWEIIKLALVDNGCGSRIITTSRVLNIIESSGEVLKLMPLSIDDSKELFYATLLCGRKGTINFDQLDDEQTIEYILQKCGYVPLALIMIASLLAGRPQEVWTKVCNSIGFGHGDNNISDDENTRKIIQFCYYDLPSHLKTCLWNLSIFPNDHVIEKSTLVRRWIAEGFVHANQESSLFMVGERYLHELVSRSMIQEAVGDDEDTNICGWTVQGMVLDWIRTVAIQENFVNIASGGWFNQDQHKSFQNLRVLSLEGCKLTADSSDGLKYLIRQSLHLRYLVLRGTNIRDLPMEIGHLKFLQTLDLTDTNVEALPQSVTLLTQLKCLRCFSSRRLKSPEGMGNLTSLEELWLGKIHDSPNFAKELSKLTELRVLHIFNSNRESSDGKWMKALVKSLSKLQKLEELELLCDELSSDMTCRYVIAPGGFPRMRHFRTNILLMYQPGAMPRLKSVELQVHVRDLKDAKFDLHDFCKLSYLRLLEKVSIAIVCREAETEEGEEAEAALRRALESHPNHPKLILRRIGQCVDDEQVRCEGDEQVRCEDDEQTRFLGGLLGSEAAPQVMSLELLRQITNNFSDKQRLGSGAFGTVYKGVLQGKELAVKWLHSMPQRLDYEEDFKKEFENLSRLDHPNIVRLIGYCYEIKRVCVKYGENYVLADDTYRALCFDYMHNGSLHQLLHDESRELDWKTCYKIIKGTCEGLKYLHKGLEKPMFHLDLKPGNILLDKNMVPKLADFSLSKLVSDNQTQEASSFLGTIRYCPPEHNDCHYFSDKFDIFSLGVIMIEIITGPEGYCKAVESQEFIDHVQENWIKRIHQATMDCTSPKCECLQVKRCIEIALECVHRERLQRPDVDDIISRLNETENNTEESAPTSSLQNKA